MNYNEAINVLERVIYILIGFVMAMINVLITLMIVQGKENSMEIKAIFNVCYVFILIFVGVVMLILFLSQYKIVKKDKSNGVGL